MAIWVISDLHLSFGVPNKSMEIFGPNWKDWAEKIANDWKKKVSDDDLVLIGGDTSWAMTLDEALPDLEWIEALPGTKLLIKGNHDYWWKSISKIRTILPPSLYILQNNAFHWKGVGIAGARLWDTPEFNFNTLCLKDGENISLPEKDAEKMEKLYQRELQRLELSLKALKPDTEKRIALTHYPPIGADLTPSRVSKLLEEYRIDICAFGHLHNLEPGLKLFGERNGVLYLLTSCDYLDFKLLKLNL